MKLFKSLLCLSLLLGAIPLSAQNKLESKTMSLEIGDDGVVKSFFYEGRRGRTEVSFRQDEMTKGPSLFFDEGRLATTKSSTENGVLSYTGSTEELSYELKYSLDGEAFVIEATLSNLLDTAITDKTITLKPGIDTELLKYPSWNGIFFPTLLRCEPTHFWGYMLNGNGDVLTIASKDPVASWQMEYFLPGNWRGKGGHIIFSYRLDLMHKLPLPARHPQNLTTLSPKESKTWRFYITPTTDLEKVKETIASKAQVPLIDADEYTQLPGQSQQVNILSPTAIASAELTSPSGKVQSLPVNKVKDAYYSLTCNLAADELGLYTLNVKDEKGYVAQSHLSARQTYSWYMDKARDGAIFNTPYACSHLESWLGLHSGLLARKYKPVEDKDKFMEDKLNLILSLQWEEESGIPKFMYDMRKVANTAQMVSVLVDAYEATGKIAYLDKACQLANIVMTFQYETGDYARYTAIFYPAKSLMELILAEKDLRDDPKWAKNYDIHYASVKRAIDYLVARKDNIVTEGQQTFEDGMLSCSATQIAMFAMMQTDPQLKEHYTQAAQLMIDKHRVLDQSIVPDSRFNGGSIRFWEAQYDVLETEKWNFINSPHGWSAWHIYGLWYMYQLTGREEFLLDAKNAINSCVQLIDGQTGELRWAFVVDPYCEVSMLRPSADKKNVGERYDTVIGEQYVGMVRNFNYAEDPATVLFGMPRTHGWSCDNDVHEIFKCMEEICLTSAYVHERADGSFITWNCQIDTQKGQMKVTPSDSKVQGLHLNLKNDWSVSTSLPDGEKSYQGSGVLWLGKRAFPEFSYTPAPAKERILRNGYN